MLNQKMRPRHRFVRSAGIGVAVFMLLCLAAACAMRQPTRGEYPYVGDTRAEAPRLRNHVDFLATQCVPRNPESPEQLAKAAEYVRKELERWTPDVRIQRYEVGRGACENIVARFDADGPKIIVGAHYDASGPTPGADDNASGVAGLLELARLLASAPVKPHVELVAYSTEEPPYFDTNLMGSVTHARSLHDGAEPVRCMIALEMIGYYTDRQSYDIPLLGVIYPRHGRFAAAIGGWRERGLVRHMKRAFRGASSMPIYSYSGPAVPGVDFSDHRSYWDEDIPAFMVTDTAFLRNPHYHTPADTPDTLDYEAMAQVVDGVYNFVLHVNRMP
jgi:hypothetical protein